MISIIIPTYNRAHLIGETLDSVIAQTYENWECIMVDDGSTDYTDELMEFYCKKDPRIQYCHRPQDRLKGPNACRNYGYELSKGKFINWLDSDDLLSQNKLEEQLWLLEHKQADIAICKWGILKHNEIKIFQNLPSYNSFCCSRAFLKAVFESHGYFPPHIYLITRKIIDKTGLWNEHLQINQDGEYMIRLICNSSRFYFADKGYGLYRQGGEKRVSLINSENVLDYYNSWKLIENYLKIRFKEDIPEFENVKRQAFTRIPEKLSYVYLQDNPFFFDLLKMKNEERIVNKIRRFVKRALSKL